MRVLLIYFKLIIRTEGIIMKFSKEKKARISIELFLNQNEGKQRNRSRLKTQIPTAQAQHHINQKQNLMFSPHKIHSKFSHLIPQVQSLNISKHNIEPINTQQNYNQIQFSKNQKNKLKIKHQRTQSNHFQCHQIKKTTKNDQMSNFSNSLENISREVIEIPFAKRIILPSRRPQMQLINYQKNTKPLEFKRKFSSKKNSVEKFKISKNQANNFSKCPSIFIPKPKKVEMTLIETPKLSDFILKPKKITQSGSIIYLSLHKKLKMIFAIKSIRKGIIKTRLNDFIKQLKLGYLQQNPNISRIFGFFSDEHNVYLIKQYIDEQYIMNLQQKSNQSDISLTITQVLIGYISLMNKTSDNFWLVNGKNLVKTHGVCKITNFKLLDMKRGRQSQPLLSFKKLISFLMENNEDEVKFKEKGMETSDSILFLSGLKYSKEFNSFKMLIDNMVSLQKNSVLKVWNHPFLTKQRMTSIYYD